MQPLWLTALTLVSFIFLVDEIFFIPGVAEQNEHAG